MTSNEPCNLYKKRGVVLTLLIEVFVGELVLLLPERA